MAWSKTVAAYPAQVQETFTRLMETGEASTHQFPSKEAARRFLYLIRGLRAAHMKTKGGAYADTAARFTAEVLGPDESTIRICSVDDTEAAKIGTIALRQRREQDDAKGIGKGLDVIAGDLGKV